MKEVSLDQLIKILLAFVIASKEDARITTGHISLFVSLIVYCVIKESKYPLNVFSQEIMPFTKISGRATYYRIIRELHEYGYIDYTPSFNHFLGSMISFRLDT